MEQLDLTREVAEKVLKRAMAPVREVLEQGKGYEDGDVARDYNLTYGQFRELDRDLGALGITLATRYREQVEYQTALGVMAAENVRLHTALDELVTLAQGYKEEGDKLAGEIAKLRNVNNKLNEVQRVSQGFRSS